MSPSLTTTESSPRQDPPQSTLLTPLQKEIHYLIHTEMPTKLDNMLNFLIQFIKLLNPSAKIPKSVQNIDSLPPQHGASLQECKIQSSISSNTTAASASLQTSDHSSSATTTPTASKPIIIRHPQGARLPKDNAKSMKFRIGNLAVGHFQISGFTLTQAKLNLKSSSGSHIYALQEPCVLHNLQKAHHLAAEALNRMNKIIKQRQRYLRANISNKQLLERMYRLLMEEARLMIQVKEQLETDFDQLSCPLRMQMVIPYASVERMQNSFQPPLPRDCLLELSVQQSRCTVTLYKLLFANPHKLKDIVHRLHAPTRSLSIQMPESSQRAYIHQAHRTDLMDNKYLQDAVLAIRNAYQTCSRLKEKLDQLKDFDA